MTIEIEDGLYEALLEIATNIKTQDPRGTATPYFFQVMDKEIVAVPEGCGTPCWHYDGSQIETPEEIKNAIFEYREMEPGNKEDEDFYLRITEFDRETILQNAGWRQVNYDEKERFQNAFFTEKACQAHIKGNKHHYRKPVDYLTHAFRNPEMELIFKFLATLI